VARHRLSARQARQLRHSGTHEVVSEAPEVVAPRVGPPGGPASKVDQAGKNEKPLPDDSLLTTAEILELNRPPADVRATIRQYWADGLDAQTIAERLAEHGVTVQNVLVERYLH
jgi:hypothetical protein